MDSCASVPANFALGLQFYNTDWLTAGEVEILGRDEAYCTCSCTTVEVWFKLVFRRSAGFRVHARRYLLPVVSWGFVELRGLPSYARAIASARSFVALRSCESSACTVYLHVLVEAREIKCL